MITVRNYAHIVGLEAGGYNDLYDENKHPNVYIGTGAYIGDNVKFICGDIWIGDYTKIHDNTLICGEKNFKIGHNCWIGGGCILDTRGGLTIGNGVGIGAGSQLWSHIQFGDILQGCEWHHKKPMIIEDDVWFVGHCLVSPVHAKKQSMALLGSLVTGNMEENIVYAGNPAKPLWDENGRKKQFNPLWANSNRWFAQSEMFRKYWVERKWNMPDINDFNPIARTYIKRNTVEQHEFMKWAVPLYKYNPVEDDTIKQGF